MSMVVRKRKSNGDLVKIRNPEKCKTPTNLTSHPKKHSIKSTRGEQFDTKDLLQNVNQLRLENLRKILNVSIFVSDVVSWLWFAGE